MFTYENFEWDEAKNLANQQKHGVSFDEAQHAFNDKNRIIRPDHAHSRHEKRYFCIGLNRTRSEALTVRFTYRNGNIRIFGAGYWRKQSREYENSQLLHKR